MNTITLLHVAAAGVAVLLGTTLLLLRRGTPRHRYMGRAWALAMAVTALSSFGIRELVPGHFSWLHGLSLWVLVSLALAIAAIRRGNLGAHRRSMIGLYGGLLIAGAAALLMPGRVLHDALDKAVPRHDMRGASDEVAGMPAGKARGGRAEVTGHGTGGPKVTRRAMQAVTCPSTDQDDDKTQDLKNDKTQDLNEPRPTV